MGENESPPTEITIIELAEKFHQPFEYFEKLDYGFVKRLFVILAEQGKSYNVDD